MKNETVIISINGEDVTMPAHKVSVTAILTEAGFTPVEHYRLVRDSGDHTYTNYVEEIPIHSGERFTTLFDGQTPTS